MRVAVDTNIFLYARGAAHPYRDPCRSVLQAARDGRVQLEASIEVVQEFTHVLLRRGVTRAVALDEADEVRAQCRVAPVDVPTWRSARRLLEQHDLGVRDAVHAATAIAAGLTAIVSTDRGLDGLPSLARLDPIRDDGRFDAPS